MKKARRASKIKAVSPTAHKRAVPKLKKAKESQKPKISRAKSPRAPIRGRLKTGEARRLPMVIEPISVLPVQAAMSQETITDLPFSYNETKLVLMVRDPYWAFTYWDFSADTWNWIMVFRERDPSARPKLRVHNLDQGTYEDKDVFLDAKNWYLELSKPENSFEVELGLLDSQGNFHVIAKSNRVRTPRSRPSDKIDDSWALSEFEFSEIYRLSGGGKTGHASSDVFSSFRRR
jgi:uncharacterized protein